LDLIKAIILGIVQGLSEFLPISSSGHLVLAEEILHYTQGGLAFEVFVHFGTLLAVIWVFRKDIAMMILSLPFIFNINSDKISQEQRDYAKMDWLIIIGSIPAAVIGLLFEDQIESLFESHLLVLFMLFVTGLIMWSSRYTHEKRSDIKASHSILIGIAQAFAIIPGISRSGSTIVTGLWLGIDRNKVARFSFLLSAPVIFGATLVKFKELAEAPPASHQILSLALATLAAAISGYFAIVLLLKIIQKKRLEWFGVYCVAVSVIGLILVYFW
jgi:undecaprenyl-diphosphatase